jgi:hypothetical protein
VCVCVLCVCVCVCVCVRTQLIVNFEARCFSLVQFGIQRLTEISAIWITKVD